MVNAKESTDGENPSMDSGSEPSPERSSGEVSAVPHKSHLNTDPALDSPIQSQPRAELVPALRVILSSSERAIGPPLGNNERLASTLRRLHALLGRLTWMSDADFIEAIEALAKGQERPHKQRKVAEDSGPLGDLPLDEIERMITDPKTTKRRLLAIVRERFGGSTGTLAKLKHDALLERVAALAMNERSHETVARLASGDANRHSSRTTNAPAAAKGERGAGDGGVKHKPEAKPPHSGHATDGYVAPD